MSDGVLLKRFLQDDGMAHCAVCAAASLANCHDKRITYEVAKKVARKIHKNVDKEGMWSGQIGILLNRLGMKKVTIVTSDLNYLDNTWARFSKKKLLKNMRQKLKSLTGNTKKDCESVIKFLKTRGFRNKIIIDHKFGDHIRSWIDQYKPVIIIINWTVFFKSIKFYKDEPDDMRGGDENHAVLIYSYDSNGVYILDSRPYSGKHSQFKDGKYFISWEEVMTIIGLGDVILADKIDIKLVDKLIKNEKRSKTRYGKNILQK